MSAGALYTQLKYYKTLFDVPSAIEVLKEAKEDSAMNIGL